MKKLSWCFLFILSANANAENYLSASFATDINSKINGNIASIDSGDDNSSNYKNSQKIKNNFGISAAIGHKYNDKFSLELAFSHSGNKKLTGGEDYNVSIGNIEDLIAVNKNFQSKVKSNQFFINAYYNLPELSKLTPFITLGIGVSSNKLFDAHQTQARSITSTALNTYRNATPIVILPSFTDEERAIAEEYNNIIQALASGDVVADNPYPIISYKNSTQNNFAYQIGFGVSFDISKQTKFEISLIHKNLGGFKATRDNNGNISRRFKKYHINQINMGIKFFL